MTINIILSVIFRILLVLSSTHMQSIIKGHIHPSKAPWSTRGLGDRSSRSHPSLSLSSSVIATLFTPFLSTPRNLCLFAVNVAACVQP